MEPTMRWSLVILIALYSLSRCRCHADVAAQFSAAFNDSSHFKIENVQSQNYTQKSELATSCHDRTEVVKPVVDSSSSGETYKIFGEVRNSKELPEISATMIADDERFNKASNIVLFNDQAELKQYSLGEILLMGLVALVHASSYHSIYLHRYDNYQDMKRAAGPSVNNEVCIRQLENMAARIKRQHREGYRSKDMNIYQITDTWARAPPDFVLGDFFIEGSYRECVRNKLVVADDQKPADMRYCVLSVKLADWSQLDKYDIISIKAGICIPRACDSSNHKNKYELISKIAAGQLRPMEKDLFKIRGLYCLPDDDSPLRSIRHSPKARITAMCLILWVAVLVYATYKYSKIRQVMKQRKHDGAGAGHRPPDAGADQTPVVPYSEGSIKIFRMLSITNNLRLLFSTTKESSLVESSASSTSAATKEGQISAATKQNGQQREMAARAPEKKVVNLSCIEGIKVIAMCYVIMGHVVMCIPTILNNGRDMAEAGLSSLSFYLANLVPAFAVNSFFVITGLLTSYLMFRQNKAQSIITSPSKWIALIIYRYLRIMPMYALAVLYCKTLAKYTGSGPIWDYGTADLSQRRICEQEPWFYTLTFTSNFLKPMRHCIPGGWYLSNDLQFLLVTPIFMVALHLRPRLGKALLYLAILVGYVISFNSIYSSDLTDLRPIAMFLPYGFKTYVSHLSNNYTYPQYRIPAYLIGLLVGYSLFEMEEDRRRYDQLSESEKSRLAPPSWPEIFKRHGAHAITFMLTLCIATPCIGRLLPFNKAAARIMVSFITPLYHILYALGIGMLLMLSTTGHGNKRITQFLSAPSWKPFARLSLCAVLVNVEVINYIIQSHTKQQHVTNAYIMLLNTICIIGTYVVATVVCVLFEAPIRSGLNTILASLMKSATRKKKDKAS